MSVTYSLDELMDSLMACRRGRLLEQLAEAAAAVCSADWSGLVEVDPLRTGAWALHTHIAVPAEQEAAERWLAMNRVLSLLAAATGVTNVTIGGVNLLGVPVSMSVRLQVVVWVAGARVSPDSEDLLVRLATAAGRALEAMAGLDAAVRLLHGVQAFRDLDGRAFRPDPAGLS